MKSWFISTVFLFCIALAPALGQASAVTVTSIPIAGGAVAYVAVNEQTNRIYVSSSSGNLVSVIDGATNRVTATVGVGNFPIGVDVNPITNVIYVANASGGSVSVIDGNSNVVTATVSGFLTPYKLAVNSVTNQIFVSAFGTNSVAIIDGTSNQVVGTVAVGSGPYGLAINSKLDLAYVANLNDGTVSVIDAASQTVSSTFALPQGAKPGNVAFDAKANKLFVTAPQNAVIYALDATSGALLATMTGGKSPFQSPLDVKVWQPGKALVTDDYDTNLLVQASEITYQTVAKISGGSIPYGIAVNAMTGTIYVAESGAGTVNVYSLR